MDKVLEDKEDKEDKEKLASLSQSEKWESAEVSEDGTVILDKRKRKRTSTHTKKSKQRAKEQVKEKQKLRSNSNRKRSPARPKTYAVAISMVLAVILFSSVGYVYRDEIANLKPVGNSALQVQQAWLRQIEFDSTLYGPSLGNVRGDLRPEIVMADASSLLIIDAANGGDIARIRLPNKPTSQPILVETSAEESLIFVITGTSTAGAYDGLGAAKWQTELGSYIAVSSISSLYHQAEQGALILVPTNGRGLVGLRPKDGKILWDTMGLSDPYVVTNLVVGGAENSNIIYLGGLSGNIDAISINGSSPTRLWSTSLADGVVPANLVLAGDAVISISAEGDIAAINRQHGELIWQEKLDSSVLGLPAFIDKRLYLFDLDGFLYQVDTMDGAIIGKVDLGAPVENPITLVDGNLLVFDAKGRFRLIDLQNNVVLQQNIAGSDTFTGPIIVKDIDNDGNTDILSASLNGVLSHFILNR
ncbi:MAG: outer membrane protein assembly factor BamB [Candidatus Azotimanducaceae bacterium]